MNKVFFCLCTVLLSSCLTPYDPGKDYVSILRESPGYSGAHDPGFTKFVYQAPEAAPLAELAARYDLVAKAGSGDALSRMKRLMEWVNDVTTQDGSAPVIVPSTAASNLARSTDGSGTKLKCQATAQTLMEVLLAVGIPARTLSLTPRDPSDELHVVVMAWSGELARWVYFDPSYRLWVFDGSQVEATALPLDPLAIRARLASGSPLGLPAEGGWNDGPYDVDYTHYLSKNFYAFSCNAESSVGYEDLGMARTRVYLMPDGTDPGWQLTGVRFTHSVEDFFSAP